MVSMYPVSLPIQSVYSVPRRKEVENWMATYVVVEMAGLSWEFWSFLLTEHFRPLTEHPGCATFFF